jgi:hypothetical protein
VHTIAGCALARDRLRGWACRIRTQKCRDKISLERSHRFAGVQPNSGFGDCSRLSCAAGEMPRREVGIGGTVRHGSFETEPLRGLIARHVDGSMLAAIAREHRAGRRLYVVTTNLEFTAHRDLGYGRDCCQRRPGGARSVLAYTGAQWTSRGRTLREYVASDGNGLQYLIAISPNCGVPLELPVAVRSKPIAQLARYIARVSPARG